MQKLLIIFVKNPVKGRVKTRLAETVGDEQALHIYNGLLEMTKRVTDRLKVHRQVWYSRFIEREDLWSADGYEKRLQQGSDLGERMKTAFAKAFKEGFQQAAIIGSDCGELSADIIRQAYDELNGCDLVIGPSKDGGYYLLGMNSFHPQLFENKSWGTSSVLKQTLHQARALDLSYKLLPELNDIDTQKDLEEFLKNGVVKNGIGPLSQKDDLS